MKRLRSKLTFSNVVAVLALFIALGGASYAATQLPKNSVGSKQLKANAVTAAKIKNRAVTGAKIDLSSLGSVPTARRADTAASADTATTASNAASLGGVAGNRYVTATSTLPSGQTETGVFGANTNAGGFLVAVINFVPKAPAPLDSAHTIYVGETPGTAAHCPGPGGADPGYLCAYGTGESSVSYVGFYNPADKSKGGASVEGTTLYLSPTAAAAYVRGVWAYTAP